jgi:hypothetical protein
MKWGASTNAAAKAGSLMPPPTPPTGAMNRICYDFSCAICVLHNPVQDPLWSPHALINSTSREVLHNLRLFHVEILL